MQPVGDAMVRDATVGGLVGGLTVGGLAVGQAKQSFMVSNLGRNTSAESFGAVRRSSSRTCFCGLQCVIVDRHIC